MKNSQQQGKGAGSRKTGESKHRWVLGCSIVIASILAINLMIRNAEFHDVAKQYKHGMQSDTQKRLQVLSLVTEKR